MEEESLVQQVSDGTWDEHWHHAGGKLIELGPASLTDVELLSILIAPGIKGRPAEKIAEDILLRFGSFNGLANQPLEKFLKIKGMGDVKIIRLAAAMEFAKRWVDMAINELKYDRELRKEVLGD
jgi:DNA repair protein RadC